jgi:replicative DNA helicase
VLESYCLGLLLRAPDIVGNVQGLAAEDFLAIENRSIFLAFQNALEGQAAFDLEIFRAGLDPVLGEHLDAMLEGAGRVPTLPEQEVLGEIRRSVSRLWERNDRREMVELEGLLRDSQQSGPEEAALMERVDSLRRRIGERQREWHGKGE